MGKKRNLKKKSIANVSDESDSDETVVVKRKPLRSKSSLQRNPNPSYISIGVDDYDADSEADERQEDALLIDSDKETSCVERPKPFTKLREKPSLDNNSCLKEFSINLDDCMQGKKASFIHTSTEEKRRLSSQDQENISPQDFNCVSSILTAAKNLDDSLFGFNSVERKLDYSLISNSPANMSVSSQSKSVSNQSKSVNSSMKTYEKKSYSKRKYDLGFDDVPMEAPPKKNKRKKREQVVDKEKEKELWESLRVQFEEVEMHELIVE